MIHVVLVDEETGEETVHGEIEEWNDWGSVTLHSDCPNCRTAVTWRWGCGWEAFGQPPLQRQCAVCGRHYLIRTSRPPAPVKAIKPERGARPMPKLLNYKLKGAVIKPCEDTHQGRWYVVLPAPTSRWARLQSKVSSATRRGKEAGSWRHFCTLASAKAAIADKLGK